MWHSGSRGPHFQHERREMDIAFGEEFVINWVVLNVCGCSQLRDSKHETGNTTWVVRVGVLQVQPQGVNNLSLTWLYQLCFLEFHAVWNTQRTWWRHQMETFSVSLALCAGNSPVTGEFPSQRPVTRSFDAFFDLRLNKRLRKQPRRRWCETTSRSLSRCCNENGKVICRKLRVNGFSFILVL